MFGCSIQRVQELFKVLLKFNCRINLIEILTHRVLSFCSYSFDKANILFNRTL
ncbi:unnamed protein product [Paramecium sonneborni]|uniref:Uncharacterized protein n=1 Tax=Paramecium sonneborni TaxID=65129 RepID=A0A8S1MGN4_9CILI|nr:unnamed protein product [Paramecium sonneborni]